MAADLATQHIRHDLAEAAHSALRTAGRADERPPRSLRSLPPEGAHSALRAAGRALTKFAPAAPVGPLRRLRQVVIIQAEHAMSFASEFREFAIKGNVMDLAVGVIIGGAFGSAVTGWLCAMGLFSARSAARRALTAPAGGSERSERGGRSS